MKFFHYLSEVDRIELFHRIWSEPLEGITYWGGIKNDDLIELCFYNKIPLPSPPLSSENLDLYSGVKPNFLKIRDIELSQVEGITDNHVTLKFIDISFYSDIELKKVRAIDLFDEISQISVKEWCLSLNIVNHIKYYHSLINEHKIEYEYRLRRDLEHPYYEFERYLNPFDNRLSNSKIHYRENNSVIPITVSDNNRKFAYIIMETLFRIVKALNGEIVVSSSEKHDNCTIRIFDISFIIFLDEIYIKRRNLLNIENSNSTMQRPTYEKIPTGKFKLTVEEIITDNQLNRTKKSNKIVLEDIDNESIKWLFDFVEFVLISALEEKIRIFIEYSKIMIDKINKKNIEINTEKIKIEQEKFEAIQKNKQVAINNIDNRIYDFNQFEKLSMFIEELNKYILVNRNNENYDLLKKYIHFLEEQKESYDPISSILDDARLL